MRVRGIVYQVLVVASSGLVWLVLVEHVAQPGSRRIASGFGFLEREAGFRSARHAHRLQPADTYLRALMVGVLNTCRSRMVGIVLATMLGTLIGMARLSHNWLLSRLAGGYVEVMRNVPLLLQLFFWYTSS